MCLIITCTTPRAAYNKISIIASRRPPAILYIRYLTAANDFSAGESKMRLWRHISFRSYAFMRAPRFSING